MSNEIKKDKPRFSYNYIMKEIDNNETFMFDLDTDPNNNNLDARFNYIYKF